MNTRSLIFFLIPFSCGRQRMGAVLFILGCIFFINGKVVTPEGDFFFFSLDFLLYGSKNMVP